MTFLSALTVARCASNAGSKGEVPLCPRAHPEYYFEDGNLVLLVENSLFRVFRSTFTRHSAVFQDLFSLPGLAGRPAEGLDDSNPLHFSGISSGDFERLLWILYPANYSAWRARTADEWTSILSLATRWDFHDVRALAIRQLQALDMSPVDRIVLAREYDIAVGGRWVLSAYTALCERPEPLSLPEAERLGLETAMRIAQLREQLRAGGRKSSRMGGYLALTRSAANRHGSGAVAAGVPGSRTGSGDVKAQRGERVQWGIGRSYLDHGDILPPVRIAPQKTPATRRGAAAIPGTARLVAEAFGIDPSR